MLATAATIAPLLGLRLVSMHSDRRRRSVAVMHAIRSTSPMAQMGYGLISPRYDRITLQ